MELSLACNHSSIILCYTDVFSLILRTKVINDKLGDIFLRNNQRSVVWENLYLVFVPCDLWLRFSCYYNLKSAIQGFTITLNINVIHL